MTIVVELPCNGQGYTYVNGIDAAPMHVAKFGPSTTLLLFRCPLATAMSNQNWQDYGTNVIASAWRARIKAPFTEAKDESPNHYLTMLSDKDLYVSSFLALIAAFAVIVGYRVVAARRDKLPYPPGPIALPIIGNVFNMPLVHPWVVYKKWSEKYNSDVVSFRVIGQRIVVVNSLSAAQDIFTKQAVIFSDRPRMVMLSEIQGWDWAFHTMNYGPSWKEHRRVLKRAEESLEPGEHQRHAVFASRRLVKYILQSPEDFNQHLRHAAGLVSLLIAYGIDVRPNNDPYVDAVEKALEAASKAGMGSFLVDYLPVLKYLPAWVPGAHFVHEGREISKIVREIPNTGFNIAKNNLLNGIGKPNMAAKGLEKIQRESDKERKEEVLKNALGLSYAAGAETVVAAASTFILAMVLHPDVQRKAQQALSAVLKSDCLPEFSDIESIPYLHAIVRETLRWKVVTPLAIPHASSEDSVYRGYYIPKGSIVVGNAWALLQDEGVFGENTDEFRPERFLTEDGNALNEVPHPDFAFGFGRRACPGKSTAYTFLLITIASILQCYQIAKEKHSNGSEIEPSVEYQTGIISLRGLLEDIPDYAG